MTKFKICCIQSVQEAKSAISAGAAAVGLVAKMPSGPGPIPDEKIRRITDALREQDPLSVLLTSETTADALLSHIDRCQPDAVQLVDAVEAGAVQALRKAHPTLKIIQVIHVQSEASVAEARAADADMLLLDSGAPDAAVKELGGTGRVHNWSFSADIVRSVDVPVWLAGGLNPENVAEAIHAVRPYGVDICSGLRPTGVLDPDLLQAFAAEIRIS